MDTVITQAQPADLSAIFHLFEEAILFQQNNNYIGWKSFDKEFIKADVQKGFLYKLMNGENILGIFSICFNDALIWREKDKGDALYVHRVVLNQKYKGENVFKKTLDWAVKFAREKDLKYIRIDTWAENDKIIAYYKSCGFYFIENYTTPNTGNLPEQHRNLNVALLEFNVPGNSATANSDNENEDVAPYYLEKVNIPQELAGIRKYWTQKIIGHANGQLIKLAKGTGELNWHKHEDQDELFMLFKGQLTIQLRQKNIELYPYEMFIVPRATEHCPISNGDSEFLIMGLNITSNTAGGRPEKWAHQDEHS